MEKETIIAEYLSDMLTENLLPDPAVFMTSFYQTAKEGINKKKEIVKETTLKQIKRLQEILECEAKVRKLSTRYSGEQLTSDTKAYFKLAGFSIVEMPPQFGLNSSKVDYLYDISWETIIEKKIREEREALHDFL